MTWYEDDELHAMGLKFGKNVRIHRTALFWGSNISLGSNIRIDCYCVITSEEQVVIGDNVHLGTATHIFGSGGVTIGPYCGISSRCSIFSVTDDYSDGYLSNPTIPMEFRKATYGHVILEKHAIIGCASIIMPGIKIGQGAAVGAQSFVNKDIPEFWVVSGSPIRKIGTRNKDKLLKLEKDYEAQNRNRE